MKKTPRILIFITLLAAMFWPSVALAQDIQGDKIVFGGAFTLRENETLNGNLIVLLGVASVQPDATVNGDIVLVGGTVDIAGRVDGSLIGVAGLINLEETAYISEDLVSVGAEVEKAAGARVDGDLIENLDAPLSLNFPGGVNLPRFSFTFDPIVHIISFWFRVFMWAAVAVLLVLFAPKYVDRTAEVILEQPVISGGIGLLTVVIAPFALVVMVVTLILIPVSIISAIALALLWGFGLISIGVLVGRRIEETLKQDWAPVVSAGIGTFVLIAVLNGLQALVPCVGWVFPAIAGVVGLGAVLLTRLGTQPYPLVVERPDSPAESQPTLPKMPSQDDDLPPGLLDDLAGDEEELPPPV